MKLSLFVVLALLIGVLVGEFPTYPIDSTPVRIVLKKEGVAKGSLDHVDGPKLAVIQIEITKEPDISKLVEAMSPVWCRLVRPNSHEDFPMHYIELHNENGKVEEHGFTGKEFGGLCSTPQRLMQTVNNFFN